MKIILPHLRYAIVILIAAIGVYLYQSSKKELNDEKQKIERDAQLRDKMIEAMRLKEVNQQKRIDKLQSDYDQLKDSLSIERKKVKIQYLRYEKPVQVDLSTDHKRDSVINEIIR